MFQEDNDYQLLSEFKNFVSFPKKSTNFSEVMTNNLKCEYYVYFNQKCRIWFIILDLLIIINVRMDKRQKTSMLKKFVSQLDSFQQKLRKKQQIIKPADFESYKAPDIDLVSDLIIHQNSINTVVDSTYQDVKNVLKQLSQLQTRKQNINKLLDSMTAVKEVKRLSYGLGSNPHQIYKNLLIYYQIKNKLFYCDKHIQRVEQEIVKIQGSYQTQFQQQLKKSNSDNITDIAKTLNLIAQNSKADKMNTNDHLSKFYVQLVKKQLKAFEDDLFKIPITGTNTTGSYIFFDIAKQVMKVIVQTVNNYKGNIMKIGGEESLQKVIIEVFAFVMNGIILQIFMRQKKYFQVDSMDPKKIKQISNKFKDYYNQFCAIWNQIERLRAHLTAQIPSFSALHKGFQNQLSNCSNTAQLIRINSQAIEGSKAYTRFLFNKLLKNSPFVNSIWQLDYEFLNSISDSYTKSNKELFQSTEGHDFIIQTFSLLSKSLQKAFQTLNMLIISPMMSFANNNLIQQDSFHGFTQLFSRVIARMPSGQSKHYTAIVVLTNTMLLMPNALKTQLKAFIIPAQLQTHRIRLQSQLKQLSQVCEYKVRQVTNSFIQSIVSASWFFTELKQDYKKAIEKWKGFAHQINQIFLNKTSQLHSRLIMEQQFNLKGAKKLLTQQAIISLQKQIRTIIMFYQVKGCSALSSFRKNLEYIEIMLAQNQQSAKKLISKFGIDDPEQIDKLLILRAAKVD